MTDARLRLFWHRAGPLTALAAVAVVASSQGCGGGGTGGAGGTSSHSSSSTSTSTSTSTATSTATSTGTGGSTSSSTGTGGGTGGAMPFAGAVSTVGNALMALDATPDPAGTTIYFTSVDPATALPGVYKVPADGSAPAPVAVAAGAPFGAPFGIATSTDGKTLYVADPGATDPTSKTDLGVIFSVLAAGGAPAVVAGSALYSARGVEVLANGAADTIYFTGNDKTTGVPGVFTLPAAGGAATALASGAPFVDPSGIAVFSDGTVYVADTTASASHTANIIMVTKAGVASTLLSDLSIGYPCGLAVSLDGKTLYLSSLAKGNDSLLQVDITTAMGTPVALTGTSVATFTEAAGLHRSKLHDIFAWADSNAGASNGQVFVVK